MATQVKIWREFVDWCEGRGLRPLPAHPWTVAAYLRWLDQHRGAQTVRAALNVISRHHLLKTARLSCAAPERHATVQKTLELIERRARIRGLGSDLFDEGAADAPVLRQTVSRQTVSRQTVKDEEAEDEDVFPASARQSRRRALASSPRLVRRRRP